ncbi:Excision repair cross-complementation group 1 [Mortierella sp. NVP85]|nr:Excision repair cross-complementation group 1 [Mortierella sp. NVP85]
MNQDSNNDAGAAKPVKQFKLPTREEAEGRRRQIEANSKPALHFKPKGFTDSGSTRDATKSGSLASYANAIINDANSASKGRGASGSGTNNTRTTTTGSGTGGASTSIPTIGSSRQHSQQQQQKNQGQDDDFDFGDDLVLGDDLFDIDDDDRSANPKSSAATSVSSTSTTPTPGATTAGNSAKASTEAQVTPPPFVPKSKSTIVVKPSQRGNPLLQFVRNVPYEYGEIVPDFVVGLTSCVLFLSIRYHRLHPEYIYNRIAALGKSYVLRVLLILVDVDLHQQAIRELTRVAMVNDLTVVCAWSNEEAGRYVETFKSFENKPPDSIKERVDNDYISKLTDCLTQIQSVNKTDVVTLASTFGSFKNIMNASVDELGVLPGFGERKVKRLLEAFDQPFAIDPKKRRQRRR